MDLHICPQCKTTHVNDISFCSAKCEAQHKQGREELKRAFALYELYKEYAKYANANPTKSFWLKIDYDGDMACVTEEGYNWTEDIVNYNTFSEVKAKLEKLNEEQSC